MTATVVADEKPAASPTPAPSQPANSTARVVLASLVGTTIEFYDFYVYATAAVLVFPTLFFPTGDALVSQLSSFVVFGAAMIARPIGAVVFGHFGDKHGRKSTLVASLLTMGIATFLIGCLPTYATVGWVAALLLVLLRLTQGFALGGEWSGAALVATENAPKGKRAWYGTFPRWVPRSASSSPTACSCSSTSHCRTSLTRPCSRRPSRPGAGASRSCSRW